MIRPDHPSMTHRAFTLVELIATMTVLSIIALMSTSMILNNADGYLSASTTSQLHHELSMGLDRIVRELRRIDRDRAASGIAPNVDAVSPTSIDWRNSSDEAGHLQLNGTTLVLAVNGSADHVLLDDVAAFSVQAFDERNVPMSASLTGAACDSIRRVAISITLQRFGVSETLDAKVFLRSTMAGL